MSVRRLLAAGVLVPLLLTGCQESKAEPKPKLPEETTSTPSETAQPAPKGESPQEFIRRWVAAADELQETGDTAEYVAMSPGCTPCMDFVDAVEDVYAKGGSAEFAGTRIKTIERMAKGHPIFDVTEEIPKTVIRHGDTGEVEVLPGGTTTFRVTLSRTDGQWAVANFTQLAQ